MSEGLTNQGLNGQLAALRAEHEALLAEHRRKLEDIALREFESMAGRMRAALVAEFERTCDAIERDLQSLRSPPGRSWAFDLLSGVGVMGLGFAVALLLGAAWLKLGPL